MPFDIGGDGGNRTESPKAMKINELANIHDALWGRFV